MSDFTIEEITSDHPKLNEALTLMQSMMSCEENRLPIKQAHKTALQLFAGDSLYAMVIGITDNKVVGVLGVRDFRDPFMVGIGAEINNFIIDPDYRNRGYGRKMIEYVTQNMTEKYSFEWLRLMADYKKDWLVDFYKSCDYSYGQYNMIVKFPENSEKSKIAS